MKAPSLAPAVTPPRTFPSDSSFDTFEGHQVAHCCILLPPASQRRANPFHRKHDGRNHCPALSIFEVRRISLLRGWVNRPQMPLTRHASSRCSLSRSPCLVRTVLQDLAVSATLPMTSNSLLY